MVTVARREIPLSNPGKVLFPDDGITKADLVNYYARVAEHMLPHVEGRPAAIQRFPDGVAGPGFFQKDVPHYFPDYIRRAELAKAGGTTSYAVIDNPETLVYLASQACITVHVWPSRADRPQHPDRLIFDLDPGEASRDVLLDTARALRRLLDDLELPAFVKSTGSSGLHIEVPLDRSADFDEVGRFARAVADVLAAQDPERVTVEHRKIKRQGRLFLDIYRNRYAQHAVPPFSVRPLPGAPVATPLDWREATSAQFDPRRHTMRNLFRRLAHKADPWAGIHDGAVSLRAASRRLERLTAG